MKNAEYHARVINTSPDPPLREELGDLKSSASCVRLGLRRVRTGHAATLSSWLKHDSRSWLKLDSRSWCRAHHQLGSHGVALEHTTRAPGCRALMVWLSSARLACRAHHQLGSHCLAQAIVGVKRDAVHLRIMCT